MYKENQEKINIVRLVEWKKDEEEKAICEGPEKEYFAMFEEWQPKYITIMRLMTKRIGEAKQRVYCVSFVDFYMQKPRFFCKQYEWNMRFMDHCMRKYDWENGINRTEELQKGVVGEWISPSQWKKLTKKNEFN